MNSRKFSIIVVLGLAVLLLLSLNKLMVAAAINAPGMNGTSVSVRASASAVVEAADASIDVTLSPSSQRVDQGGTATFTVHITNTGQEELDLGGDALYGDDCKPPASKLGPDGRSTSYPCTVTSVTADFTNTVTVTGTYTPDSGLPMEVSDSAQAFVDALPTITVIKTASPTSVTEPGGTVTFTIEVNNEGGDDVTLALLTDDIYGNLADLANANVTDNNCPSLDGGSIVAGSKATCSFKAEVTGPPDEHINTVRAVVEDSTENQSEAEDSAKVTITEPPITRIYLPVVVNNFVVGEPNDSCAQAYPISTNSDHHFLPDDVDDWYRFTLNGGPVKVLVELTNFVPINDQIVLYRGTCGDGLSIVANNGNFSPNKTIEVDLLTAGTYHIRVITRDGKFSTTPYTLKVNASVP